MSEIDFSDIKPLETAELPQAYDELLNDPTFQKVINFVFPQVPFDVIAGTMRKCKSNIEFQVAFCKPFLEGIVQKHSDGLTGDFSAIKPVPEMQNYTYISNHRDIVLDSGLLDLWFVQHELPTVEIAIGDNLLIYPWIKTLVRINRSFIVTRSGGLHDMLQASKKLSTYIHHAINKKKSAIWIAQREGRSKDSSDNTQESILKMFAMTGEGSPRQRLKAIRLVPLSISYEYDPCDWLKAKEFQQKRDIDGFKKTQDDDLINMKTGIFGHKGRVHYQAAPCINDFLDTLSEDMPKNEFYTTVAKHIDHAIYANYRLYPSNYIALDLLEGSNTHCNQYTIEERKAFEHYLEQQLGKIQLTNKDDTFLLHKMIEMYANPAMHKLSL